MEASLDAADLISQLKQEISSDRPPMWIFCPVPFPPKPQSSSGRGRQRHRRSMEVRTVAEECRSTLLELCGETSHFLSTRIMAELIAKRMTPVAGCIIDC